MSLFSRVVVTTMPLVPKFVVGKVASRYVAGETLKSALDVTRDLNRQGAMATLDVLGEEVSERSKAETSARGARRARRNDPYGNEAGTLRHPVAGR